MTIVSTLLNYYFQAMKSINVRSVSIAIIVIIILIEFIELFIKPEDVEPTRKQPVKNKEEKSSFLRKLVKLDNKERKPEKKKQIKPYKKDELNNYYIKEENKVYNVESLTDAEEAEILGSKIIEINTVIDGNRLYIEKVEK